MNESKEQAHAFSALSLAINVIASVANGYNKMFDIVIYLTRMSFRKQPSN